MAEKFVALIRRSNPSEYWVDMPDLPGCVASGETEEQARANFAGALEAHLQTMRKNGQPLPSPREREAVLAAEQDEYLSDYLVEI